MLILFLLAGLSTSISASDLKVSTACHRGNFSAADDCFLHRLHCPADTRVVVAGAEWRYKNSSAGCSSDAASCSSIAANCSSDAAGCSSDTANCSSDAANCSSYAANCSSDAVNCSSDAANCSSDVVSCDARQPCCTAEAGDCGAALGAARVARETGGCWEGEACSLGLSDSLATLACGADVPTPPHYSLVHFFCVPKSAEVEFATSGAVTGAAASIRYRPPANRTLPDNARQQISFCRVESVDCAQHPAQVVVYTGRRGQACGVPYTAVAVGGESGSCSQEAAMTAVTRTTPFLVHLAVAPLSDVHSAWVAVRAADESTIRVLCAPVNNATLPRCGELELPSTSPPIVDSKTNVTAGPGISHAAAVNIALTVVACVLFACVVVVIILCYSRRLRKRSQMYETHSDYPVSMATYGCWMEDGEGGRATASRDTEDDHVHGDPDTSLPANSHLDSPEGNAEEPSEPPGVVD